MTNQMPTAAEQLQNPESHKNTYASVTPKNVSIIELFNAMGAQVDIYNNGSRITATATTAGEDAEEFLFVDKDWAQTIFIDTEEFGSLDHLRRAAFSVHAFNTPDDVIEFIGDEFNATAKGESFFLAPATEADKSDFAAIRNAAPVDRVELDEEGDEVSRMSTVYVAWKAATDGTPTRFAYLESNTEARISGTTRLRNLDGTPMNAM